MKKIIILLFLIPNLYSQTKITNKVLIPFREKNLWGLSDTLGNIIVKPFAKKIKDFIISYDGNFTSRYVVKTNKNFYVIDKNKTIFLPELNSYDSIRLNINYPNHFWIYKKGKAGLFYKNKEFIACLYDQISPSYNESFKIKKGELVGVINSLGKLIIPIKYNNIYQSWEYEDEKNPKFVWVTDDGLVEKKILDTKITPKYYGSISEKIVGVKDICGDCDDQYESIKKSLAKKYDFVKIQIANNLAFVTKGNKIGVVDLDTEEELVNPIYDEVEDYARDRDVKVFKVKLNGKYGLVKSNNLIVLNCEYDEINEDHVLTKDNKKGIIIFNTIYPYIKPKYLTIKSIEGIQVNENWQFGLFEVTTANGKGFVGENGVEFFKD